jgi:hypothetical protein
MGPELGELFYVLRNELIWAHWRWRQYRILYGEKESRIRVLNDAAPVFFRIVQDVMFEDTLLAIARLVSPPKSAGRPQLTLRRLPPLLMDRSLRADIERLVSEASTTAQFAVDWRHRRIAHRDLPLALGSSATPLAAASRQDVEGALDALRQVLNRVQAVICNATTGYEMTPRIGDATALLYVVRHGLLREQKRRARLENGEPDVGDFKPPEEI